MGRPVDNTPKALQDPFWDKTPGTHADRLERRAAVAGPCAVAGHWAGVEDIVQALSVGRRGHVQGQNEDDGEGEVPGHEHTDCDKQRMLAEVAIPV